MYSSIRMEESVHWTRQMMISVYLTNGKVSTNRQPWQELSNKERRAARKERDLRINRAPTHLGGALPVRHHC